MNSNLTKSIRFINNSKSPISRFLTKAEKEKIGIMLINWVDEHVCQLIIQRSGCGLSAIMANKHLKILGEMTIDEIYREAANVTGEPYSPISLA